MSESNENLSSSIPLRKPRSIRKRLGCGFILLLWFGLILTPCLCIVLATQGEISVQLGNPSANVLRFWLVNEARERGIGISSPTVFNISANAVCIRTNVSFLFWQGQGKSTNFCECYVHTGDGAFTQTNLDSCPS